MTGLGLPILTYHAIDTSGAVTANDPAWFAATLAALAEAGWRSVDLADWIARGRPEIERGFALAFDDGLASVRAAAAEIVARHGFRATVFLVTDRMGTDNAWPGQPAGIPRVPLLAWSDLAALEPAGFSFAAHGRAHARLDRCDDARLDDELRGSRDAIEQRTGRPCRLLAYPYGACDWRVRSAAARHFDAAFGTRLDYSRSFEDVFRLSRIDAHYLRSPRSLRALLDGRWRGWLRWRRTLRNARRTVTRAGALLHVA
jgi:peptidoglycan/xylan/chitin deacetylase (PgdA/CDA1 family)